MHVELLRGRQGRDKGIPAVKRLLEMERKEVPVAFVTKGKEVDAE